MRTILFFDLPMESKEQNKEYRIFVKRLKENGFYRLQKSVFVRMSIDNQSSDSSIRRIKKSLPSDGLIQILEVTEKQFASMILLVGENNTDVINSDERIIEI